MTTDTTQSAYDAAIAYAAERGRLAGENAAGWWAQDTIGGRLSRATTAADNARRILRGIADGDPAVLDTLPAADLSGQWADTLTGPSLTADALRAAGLPEPSDDALTAERAELFTEVCDAYETAFSDAVESAIVDACKAILA